MSQVKQPYKDLTKPIKQKKKRKPLKQQGKQALLWAETRHKWIQANAAPSWICHLQIAENCPKILILETLTLDHYHTRSSRPDLRYDLDNLRPACFRCNGLRGSRSMQNLVKEYPQVDFNFVA